MIYNWKPKPSFSSIASYAINLTPRKYIGFMLRLHLLVECRHFFSFLWLVSGWANSIGIISDSLIDITEKGRTNEFSHKLFPTITLKYSHFTSLAYFPFWWIWLFDVCISCLFFAFRQFGCAIRKFLIGCFEKHMSVLH